MSSNTTNYTGLQVSPEAYRLWATIGFMALQLQFLGTLFVLVQTFLRWRRFGTLSFPQRIPFYIAIVDFIFYLNDTANAINSLTSTHALSAEMCALVGGVIFYFISVNMFLVLTVAVTTYLGVCHSFHIDLGPYDWKLLGTVITLPIIATIIGYSAYGLDPSGFMCFVNYSHIHIIAFDLALFLGTLATCAFCYIAVYVHVLRTKSQLECKPTRPGCERRVIKKILSYVLMFIFNWGPIVPYMIGILINRVQFSFYLLVSVGRVSGGILNGIQYAINEGFWIKNDVKPGPESSGDSNDAEMKDIY